MLIFEAPTPSASFSFFKIHACPKLEAWFCVSWNGKVVTDPFSKFRGLETSPRSCYPKQFEEAEYFGGILLYSLSISSRWVLGVRIVIKLVWKQCFFPMVQQINKLSDFWRESFFENTWEMMLSQFFLKLRPPEVLIIFCNRSLSRRGQVYEMKNLWFFTRHFCRKL